MDVELRIEKRIKVDLSDVEEDMTTNKTLNEIEFLWLLFKYSIKTRVESARPGAFAYSFHVRNE